MNGLKRVLDRLGLKQSELAKLLDVSPRTVSLWATGDVALPGPVRAYLRMLLLADPTVRSVELARLSGQRVEFQEGLYSVLYGDPQVGSEEWIGGSGVALLKGGRLVGSDADGTGFEGTYRFDSNRQTNHFHVWAHLRSGGALVTGGEAGASGTVIEVIADFERADPVATTVVQIDGRPLSLTLAYLGPLPS